MKRNQSGFTLIEIAIVLVIIGLLLGGVMKGQELINSAKVKNLASDFKNTSLYIYSYQDKYKALPGDDALATSHVSTATLATTHTLGGSNGDGRIDGKWDDYATKTEESYLFWEHVRKAGIATGITNINDATGYPPRNTLGGLIGVTNSVATKGLPITGLSGAYIICSGNIPGKFAKQLDIMMDDGAAGTGSMRVSAAVAGAGSIDQDVVADPVDETLYSVCMGV